MNLVIPFTKDIKFKTNIKEILSVSLEHDYTTNDTEVLGNFTISGEYKMHEVSVNKEKFSFVLPFSVSMPSKINPDTLIFEIEDFTYEVINDDTLKVNIEYSIKGEKIKDDIELLKTEEDISLDKLLDEIDEERKSPSEEEIKEKKEEQRVTKEEENTILNNIKIDEDTYVTYNIHIMREKDTIDEICSKYNTNEKVLEKYNDLKNLSTSDKIIIPNIDE